MKVLKVFGDSSIKSCSGVVNTRQMLNQASDEREKVVKPTNNPISYETCTPLFHFIRYWKLAFG